MSEKDPKFNYVPGRTTTLGLDPSMTSTGYGVIRGDRLIAAGKITTKPSQSEPDRIWVIFSEVLDVIREFDVDHVAIEEFTAFYRSTKKVGGSAEMLPADLLARLNGEGGRRRGRHDRESVDPRAMYLLKAAQTATQMAALVTGSPLFLYKVSEWKGGQSVGKEAIIQRAQMLYKVKTRDNNITDAIMIAHHHVTHGRFMAGRAFAVSHEDRQAALAALANQKLSATKGVA